MLDRFFLILCSRPLPTNGGIHAARAAYSAISENTIYSPTAPTMTPIAANGKSPKLYRIVVLISPLPAQSRMPKRSSAMPFETLLLIRTTLLKFKYTTSLSRLYHKRGCRTRSNPMLQPLAITRFREKILKFFWFLFL